MAAVTAIEKIKLASEEGVAGGAKRQGWFFHKLVCIQLTFVQSNAVAVNVT